MFLAAAQHAPRPPAPRAPLLYARTNGQIRFKNYVSISISMFVRLLCVSRCQQMARSLKFLARINNSFFPARSRPRNLFVRAGPGERRTSDSFNAASEFSRLALETAALPGDAIANFHRRRNRIESEKRRREKRTRRQLGNNLIWLIRQSTENSVSAEQNSIIRQLATGDEGSEPVQPNGPKMKPKNAAEPRIMHEHVR